MAMTAAGMRPRELSGHARHQHDGVYGGRHARRRNLRELAAEPFCQHDDQMARRCALQSQGCSADGRGEVMWVDEPGPRCPGQLRLLATAGGQRSTASSCLMDPARRDLLRAVPVYLPLSRSTPTNPASG